MTASGISASLTKTDATNSNDPLNRWHGEFVLGGSAQEITVARNQDGRLEIFYVGINNTLYHNWQTQANGLLWHGETAFPGDSARQVVAAANQNGVLEIFYVGTNNELYHNRQSTANSTLWTGEARLSGASANAVAVAANADGRLEVFYVGTNGDLYHNRQTAPNSTTWSGESRLSGASAKQIAVGLNTNGELEVFYVGTNNDLYHNRQTAPNATTWGGEARIANDSAQQICVARNANGELEIFYVGTNNDLYHNQQTAASGTAWAGETRFPNDSATYVVAGQNKDGRLEIFYVGTNGDLYHNWQTVASAATWAGEAQFPNDGAKQIAVGTNQDGRLEVFYVGTNSLIYHNWQTLATTGFGSNSNFILVSNCNPLTDLSVTIEVTQDMVCDVSSGATKGFSFQLNAYSPMNQKTGYQQYVMALWGNTIECSIDNWNATGASETVKNFFQVATLPSDRIPAGYKLSIDLKNDAKGNITTAIYTVVDNTGKTVANVTKTVSSDETILAPISAFELNIVGAVNSESSILSSGAGTIAYSSSVPMTPTTSQPACTEAQVVTAETANTSYATLAGVASKSISQAFNITSNESFFRKREGKIRPRTVIPGR